MGDGNKEERKRNYKYSEKFTNKVTKGQQNWKVRSVLENGQIQERQGDIQFNILQIWLILGDMRAVCFIFFFFYGHCLQISR